MSTKRKNTGGKPKNRAKSRKIEYDEEDISSEHESEVDDAEAGSNADGEDAAAEDALADVTSMPELPAPEVRSLPPRELKREPRSGVSPVITRRGNRPASFSCAIFAC